LVVFGGRTKTTPGYDNPTKWVLVKSISFSYTSPWRPSQKQAFPYTFQGYLQVSYQVTIKDLGHRTYASSEYVVGPKYDTNDRALHGRL